MTQTQSFSSYEPSCWGSWARAASTRQRVTLQLRYGFGESAHTLQQVADRLGITRERVRQIQSKAEEKLASRLRAGGFEPLPAREEIVKTPEVQVDEVSVLR